MNRVQGHSSPVNIVRLSGALQAAAVGLRLLKVAFVTTVALGVRRWGE